MNDLFRNFYSLICSLDDAIEGRSRSVRYGRIYAQMNSIRRRASRSTSSASRRIDRYASRLSGDSGSSGSAGAHSRDSYESLAKSIREILDPIAQLLGGLAGGMGGSGGSGGVGIGGGYDDPEDGNDSGSSSSSGKGSFFDRRIREAIELLTAEGYAITPPQSPPRREISEPPPGFTSDPPEPGPAPFPLGSRKQRVSIGGSSRVYDENDPVFSGEMVDVDSSNVHSIGYLFDVNNPTKGTLMVRFLQSRGSGGQGGKNRQKGPGPLYYYHGVHPNTFDAFLKAGSKGGFVWDRLRIRGTVSGHRVPYELRGITNGYVPRKATRYGQKEYFLQRQMKMRSTRTGSTRTFTSSLPDQFVQDLNGGGRSGRRPGPTGFVPRSGAANNGAARRPGNGR